MRNLTKALVACGVALAVVVPTVAVARPLAEDLPKSPAAVLSPAEASPAGGAAVAPRLRGELAVRRQKAVFDKIAQLVSFRLRQVGKRADAAAGNGKDVAAVEALAAQAQAKLDAAKATEKQALEEFKAAENATDKAAALAKARETAKRAMLQLREAVRLMRDAASKLREVAGIPKPAAPKVPSGAH